MFDSVSAVFLPKKGTSAVPVWREGVVTLISLALLLALMAGTSTLLGLLAMRMPSQLFDIEIGAYRFIAGHASPRLVDIILLLFNDPGIDYTVIVAACLTYVWIKRRNRILVALFALGLAFSIGAWTIPYTHWFGYRLRPFMFAPDVIINPVWRQTWSQYPSFPSGHLRELIGLSIVLLHFWRGARWYVVGYAAFLAFSRVYVGAHFVYDIIGGVIIGLQTGIFALLAAEKGSKAIAALGKTRSVRRALNYLSEENSLDMGGTKPLQPRGVRSLIYAVLLLAGTFCLGLLVFTESPSILASYFFDTDNSLVAALGGSFDPSSAPIIHALFLNGFYTLSALAILILGRAILRGKTGLGQAVASIALAVGASSLLAAVFSPYFAKARPFFSIGEGLPDIWRSQWSGPASFPDAYLLTVVALSVLLATYWPRLRVPAYICSFAVAVSLCYFGVAWPIASLATIVAGYWVARWSVYVCSQLLPVSWQLANGHPQSVGKITADGGNTID